MQSDYGRRPGFVEVGSKRYRERAGIEERKMEMAKKIIGAVRRAYRKLRIASAMVRREEETPNMRRSQSERLLEYYGSTFQPRSRRIPR